MRQRAALLRTYLMDNDVVLLDEPTLGLDVLAKRDLIQGLKQINRDKGVTLLVTSHDMDDLRDMTIRQLRDGRPVWFGSDVGQFSDRKGGYLTTDAYAVDELFSTDFPMTKEQRLDYGESLMTHAMVITGVDLDDEGKPVRWKVENSWGKDRGRDGYYVMSDEWFGEFAYQILLDRKYFSPEQAAAFDTCDQIQVSLCREGRGWYGAQGLL
jgi:bleomycin hydrolase